MSQKQNTTIAVIGIDIGKNSFHVVGHDARGAIVLRQKWSRGEVEARLARSAWKPASAHMSRVAGAVASTFRSFAALVRCVSGLLVTQIWPLDLMLCADPVPNK